MATTTYKSIILLEVGQKEKEAAINAALETLSASPEYLGEYTTAGEPSSNGIPGSTYYNSDTSKLMFLNSSEAWIASS